MAIFAAVHINKEACVTRMNIAASKRMTHPYICTQVDLAGAGSYGSLDCYVHCLRDISNAVCLFQNVKTQCILAAEGA